MVVLSKIYTRTGDAGQTHLSDMSRAPKTDARVAAYVEADPRFDPFFVKMRDLLLELLPAYVAEGKTHLAIGFGCTGGRHRSVAVAEKLAKALAEAGWHVSKRHRELERRAPAAPPIRVSEA